MRAHVLIAAVVLTMMPTFAFAQSAAFDPEAASQAYLATLNGAARAKSDAYFEGGYWLILWGTLVAILSELVVLKTGLSVRFRDWAERVTKRRFLQAALYSVPYGVAGTLIALPWTIYTQFVRERQYDLMNQSFGGWAGEYMINLFISIVMMAIILPLIIAGIRRSPTGWWKWGTGFAALFIALSALIAPVFLAPLFNTYTELKPGPVRDRIVAMAAAKHVPAEHIYVFDQSKQTKRVSANVSGLGPTIRISLNDNLLNRTTLPQTASVMGHELGHYVLGHVWKLIPAFALILGGAFFLSSRLVPVIISRWGSGWGLRGVDDIAAVPVYAMVIAAAFMLVTPLTNTIVRMNESDADAFGLDAAREPDGFAKTALMLSEYRKIEPGPIEEMLFFDHPSGATRIRMAMAWKAKHLAEIEARAN
jgi:STE24 endopeptidase